YNDSSCVACHNAGGSGGAGAINKNIEILSAGRGFGGATPAQAPNQSPVNSGAAAAAVLDPLLQVHAGVRSRRAVVLHKFGTDPNYDSWRARALNPSSPQDPRMTALERRGAATIQVQTSVVQTTLVQPVPSQFAGDALNVANPQAGGNA